MLYIKRDDRQISLSGRNHDGRDSFRVVRKRQNFVTDIFVHEKATLGARTARRSNPAMFERFE